MPYMPRDAVPVAPPEELAIAKGKAKVGGGRGREEMTRPRVSNGHNQAARWSLSSRSFQQEPNTK
jgi:hypothetical protein